MPEPTSSSAIGAGLFVKYASILGAGALGALVMAAVDPPKTRKELFLQAASSGVGSMIFGPFVVKVLDRLFDWYDLAGLDAIEHIEMVVPVYFICGAMAWGLFGALAKFRELVRLRGGQSAADRFLGKESDADH